MIPIWSSRICCQFLLTNDKLNHQLSEKLKSLFPSSLVMCSYLILWTFLVELLVLTRSSKLTKQKKLKDFFPMSGSTIPKSWTTKSYLHTILSLANCVIIIIRSRKDYNDFENLSTSNLSSEQAVCKLRLHKIPPTGDENYAYLWSVWVNEGMKSSKDFLMWYKNKDVVPTLEAVQKIVEFYHQKEIDMFKLGFTLHKLANTCLHKSTDSKFYPFTESDKDLLEKIREDMVGVYTLHCLYTQDCSWQKFYPQINEFVQVNCRHRRKPTLSLFDVSTNAYWIVYKMELWLWNTKIHASTERNTLLRKYGPFLLSTNSSGM